MVFGSTEIEAVGAGGGGGGGGGGGAAFFLQAPSIMTALKASTSVNHFMRWCFTFDPPATPMIAFFEVRRSVYLFPTPIRLSVAAGKGQLPRLGAVGQHHPDFLFARAAGLKHDMSSVGRPRR